MSNTGCRSINLYNEIKRIHKYGQRSVVVNIHKPRCIIYFSSKNVSALNNLCNFLVTLNAACNFLLYCALSDKYRKTVKQLFLGKKLMIRQNTMSSSRYSGQTTGTSIYNRSPSTPRNNSAIVRNRLHSVNKGAGEQPVGRFSITPSDYANFTREIDKQRAKAQSLMAADYVTDANKKNNSSTVKI